MRALVPAACGASSRRARRILRARGRGDCPERWNSCTDSFQFPVPPGFRTLDPGSLIPVEQIGAKLPECLPPVTDLRLPLAIELRQRAAERGIKEDGVI